MPTFNELLKKSEELTTKAEHRLKEHHDLIEKAHPLAPDQIILPPEQPQISENNKSVADYVTGQTDDLSKISFKPAEKSDKPKSFAELLKKDKPKDSDRSILHGTGFTKREINKSIDSRIYDFSIPR